MSKVTVVLFIICISLLNIKCLKPKGEIWPKPLKQQKSDLTFILDLKKLQYKIVNQKCNLLKKVADRYLSNPNILRYKNKPNANEGFDYLTKIDINLTSPCNDNEYPYYDMDESYTLEVSNNSKLVSNTIWGIMRGLESFLHLPHIDNNMILINANKIEDKPLYSHRGLLIDTSRHFLSVSVILNILEGMAINKLNVLHWHIVDDQSFPYGSKVLPELSNKGAYYIYEDPTHTLIYSQKDIQDVIEYARERGIRVIPEFDTPGHTHSWFISYPEIFTNCQQYNEPMNPIRNETYDLIHELFAEVQNWFPDQYFHIGGDEVDTYCWSQDAEIQDFVKKNNITNVQAYFTDRLVKQCFKKDTKLIAWEETYSMGAKMPIDSFAEVWKTGYENTVVQLVSNKVNVLLAAPWYLDRYVCSNNDFRQLYVEDPRKILEKAGKKEYAKYMVGGEACMWGEKIDNTNAVSTIFPRAAAPAEVLWSGSNGFTPDVTHRIEEHACRMCQRHVMAEPPIGPGVCTYTYADYM